MGNVVEVNSFFMGSASATPASLERPVDMPTRTECTRMRTEIQVSCKNTSGSAKNFTVADAIDALKCLMGATTMAFGDKEKDVVDNALSVDDLRQLLVGQTGKDILIAGKEWNKQLTTDILATAVANNAAYLLKLEVPRSFQMQRLGKARNNWCPGATQMSQLQYTVKRGAVFSTTGYFVQDGVATFLVMLDTHPATHDRWSRCIQLFKNTEGGRVSHGPAEPGVVFYAYEFTAAGASTALGLVNLTCRGDNAVLSGVQASRVVTDGDYEVPPGDFDLGTLVTLLMQPAEEVDANELHTGQFALENPGQDVSPLQTGWIWIPEVGPGYSDNYVGKNVVKSTNPEVRVISSASTHAPGMVEHVAATMPLNILTPAHHLFETAPSRAYVHGVAPATYIPKAVSAAAQAAVKAQPDKASQASAVQQHLDQLALVVPGLASAHRNPDQKPSKSDVATHLFGELGKGLKKFF